MKSICYEKLEFKHFSSLILGRTIQMKCEARCEKLLGRFARSSGFRNVPWFTDKNDKIAHSSSRPILWFLFLWRLWNERTRGRNREKHRKGEKDENTPWIWLYSVLTCPEVHISGILFQNWSIKDCILYINKTYFLYKGRRSVKRPMARKILQYYDNSFKR